MRPAPTPPRLHVPAALILLALGCVVFGALAADLEWHGPVTGADAAISRWFHAHPLPLVTQAMFAVTALHSTIGIVLMATAAAAALWWGRQFAWLSMLVLTVPGGMLLNTLVKQAFQRVRPHFDEPLVTLASYSFPSGHTAGATLWWGFALIWLFAHSRRTRDRVLGSAFVAAMIMLTALSRVYLGAHYPSDVLAAAAEGVIWLALCFTTLGRWSSLRRDRIDG